MIRAIFFICCTALLLASCDETRPDGLPVKDTPTSGEISIMVDEGYKPVIASAFDVFDSIYRAKINAQYVPESVAFKALVEDSVSVIIVTRPLKADEMEFFKARQFEPKLTPIAYDAVAFIVHPGNPNSSLTTDQIKGILNGSLSNWKQVDPKNNTGQMQVVFDHSGSSTVRYCRDSIAGVAELPKYASAVKTNKEVIDWVAKHKNAVGIIGANWISDTDDKGAQEFLKEIKVLDIAMAPGEKAYGPYQAYMATKKYPYRRTIYVMNAQGRAGLGLGIASFLASDPGQRIMMKDGLLAANVPFRIVQVSKE